jgi:hypothetical protein
MAPARANPRGPVVQGTDGDGRKTCRQAQDAKPGAHPKAAPTARRDDPQGRSPGSRARRVAFDPGAFPCLGHSGLSADRNTPNSIGLCSLAYRCGGSSRLADSHPRTGFPFKPPTLQAALGGHREAARMLAEACAFVGSA